MNRLLLNIGNTHTQVAPFTAGNQPLRATVLDTAELLAAPECIPVLAGDQSTPLFAACVVPGVGAALRRAWPARQIRFLQAADATELDFRGFDTATVGADRLANALGVLELAQPPFLVLDCGTAITLEAVDAGFVFRGGAILPGRRLLRRALHEHTAQLPLVELRDTRPVALGRNTEAAILAGTDLAALGAAAHLLGTARNEIGAPACPVFLTGGDADFFAAHLQLPPPAPVVAPDLTLRGLARWARRSQEK